MKRNDMVFSICCELDLINDEDDNYILAQKILNILEENGMLPPMYMEQSNVELEGKLVTISTPHFEWEKEDDN